MIDEELYQFATDELNSDRRDSELWNRACALARDDHDEARFLYTNLRVEELLEQKANGEPMPEMPESVKGAASVAFDLDAAPNAVDSAPLGLGSALDVDNASDDAEEIISSSNRAFTDDSSDLSEDLILELETSNEANASEDDAPMPDPAQLAKEAEDEASVTLDPNMFAGDSAEPNLDLGDAPVEIDLPAVDASDSLAANVADGADSEAATDMDMDIASLAAQAAEQLGGKATAATAAGAAGIAGVAGIAGAASSLGADVDLGADIPSDVDLDVDTSSFEDALDSPSSLDTTAFNTDKLDSIATETGAFEPIDDAIDSTTTATPLPDAVDVVPESTTLNENELAFLDASIEQGRDDVIDQQREVLHQKDALTEELERQADTFLDEDSPAEASSAALTGLDESDLMPSAVDVDSINTSSANIEAVSEAADIEATTASNDLEDVFSSEQLDQLKEQNTVPVEEFDDAAINAMSQNDVVGEVVGDGISEQIDGLSGAVGDIGDTVGDSAGGLAGGMSSGLAGGVAGAAAAGGAALATSSAFAKNQGSQISQDFSQPGNVDFGDDNPSLDQAELLSGKGRTYRVFSKGPDNNRAVKTGVSWAALFFTFPWLLIKRMPLLAIVYALLWITLIAGLVVTGLPLLDATKDSSNTLAIWPLAFAALAVIGLILLPFIMGNRWHARSLEKRGFQEIALVRAKGSKRAIDRIMQMAS